MVQEVQVADHQVVVVKLVVMVLTTQVVVEVEIMLMDLVEVEDMVLLLLDISYLLSSLFGLINTFIQV